MDFFDLSPDARHARVRDLFGLGKAELNDLAPGTRTAVIVFSSKYPPKLVILQQRDLKLLEPRRIATYCPRRGWV